MINQFASGPMSLAPTETVLHLLGSFLSEISDFDNSYPSLLQISITDFSVRPDQNHDAVMDTGRLIDWLNHTGYR